MPGFVFHWMISSSSITLASYSGPIIAQSEGTGVQQKCPLSEGSIHLTRFDCPVQSLSVQVLTIAHPYHRTYQVLTNHATNP
jgi:hypothetical protein